MWITYCCFYSFLPVILSAAKAQKEIAVDNYLDSAPLISSQPVIQDVVNASASNDTAKTICTTASCQKTADKFLIRINSSADPCDDFFEYACGKWVSTHEIPDNESEISDFYFLTQKMKKVGQQILRSMKGHMFPSEVKAKTLFRQCSNEAEIEKLRAQPLLDILQEFVSGWPLLESNWDASRFDIFDTLVKNFFVGNEPFFAVTVAADVENPLTNVIQINSPSTYAAIDVLTNEVTGKLYTESYLTFLMNMTSLLLRDLNSTVDVNTFSPNITEIVEIERSFGMAKLTAVENADDSIYLNRMTLSQLQDRYQFNSSILRNLTNYVREYYSAANLSSAITDNTTVVVPNLRFLPVIDARLAEFESQGEEGKRRLANYIGWQLVSGMPIYLPKEYRYALAEYSQRITGRKAKRDPPVGERCLSIVTQTMPLCMGAMYVRDSVPSGMKSKATMMVNDIQVGFRELLDGADWMDNATYQKAMVKLNAIINVVGYPDIFLTNTSAIDEEYQYVTIQPTYMETITKSIKNAVVRVMKRWSRPNIRYNPIEDTMDITEVNAFYSHNNNLLTMLAAILQLPFYDSKSPQYLNYGAIGSIIGHETTHGFDDTGAKYDDQGFRRVWWTNTTAVLYEDRKKGMIEQYNNYTLPAGKVNGQLTLGENIADNGGLRASFKGYTRYLQRLSKPEPVLPGLVDYTPLQLFFLSFGQVWCNKERIESERVDLLTEEHSPNRFRVNGAVSNMPEFAQTFNCTENARMNPAVKQVVW
ncbi:neprilysin-11-like [Paramacrobiotus metropolitanus]|uniref:neprilysin-11-like n=1 Tax=Paramacrobiotus metropolitanus TaxID=2943436 RepID=UPI002446374C|nr:neprilysin-11-like [Paramacrobiotus metropolitanus]